MHRSYVSSVDSASTLLESEPPSKSNALSRLCLTSILLVEDEPVVSAFLECALEHLGFNVTTCASVETALQAIQEQIPTLILTDCNLPHRSGIELIKIVVDQCDTIPIIGMSAQHYKGVEMIESGAIAFLPKPIEMDTLKRVVVQIADCGLASAMSNVNARFY